MTEGVLTRRQPCGTKKTQRRCRGWFIASDSGQARSHVTPPRTPTCSPYKLPRQPPPPRAGSQWQQYPECRALCFVFLTLGACRRRKTTCDFHTSFSAVLTVQTRTKVKPVAIFTGDGMLDESDDAAIWADVFGDRSPPCGGNVEHTTVSELVREIPFLSRLYNCGLF